MGSQGANQTTTNTQVNTRPKESVSVDIRGKRLSIRTNHDPEFVQELAGYIDQKLQALQRAAPSAPFEKLLMLVSMTVAEELFSTREELDMLQKGVQARAMAMMDILADTEAA